MNSRPCKGRKLLLGMATALLMTEKGMATSKDCTSVRLNAMEAAKANRNMQSNRPTSAESEAQVASLMRSRRSSISNAPSRTINIRPMVPITGTAVSRPVNSIPRKFSAGLPTRPITIRMTTDGMPDQRPKCSIPKASNKNREAVRMAW